MGPRAMVNLQFLATDCPGSPSYERLQFSKKENLTQFRTTASLPYPILAHHGGIYKNLHLPAPWFANLGIDFP